MDEKDYLPTLLLFLGAAVSFVFAPVYKSALLLLIGFGLAVASIANIFTGKPRQPPAVGLPLWPIVLAVVTYLIVLALDLITLR